MTLIAAFIAFVFLYSLVSRRMERTVLTAPILFTTLGALMSLSHEVLSELVLDRKDLLLIAELGLVITLFTDASRVRPKMLKGEVNLPVRLLSTGMLLTIMLGVLCAVVVLGTRRRTSSPRFGLRATPGSGTRFNRSSLQCTYVEAVPGYFP